MVSLRASLSLSYLLLVYTCCKPWKSRFGFLIMKNLKVGGIAQIDLLVWAEGKKVELLSKQERVGLRVKEGRNDAAWTGDQFVALVIYKLYSFFLRLSVKPSSDVEIHFLFVMINIVSWKRFCCGIFFWCVYDEMKIKCDFWMQLVAERYYAVVFYCDFNAASRFSLKIELSDSVFEIILWYVSFSKKNCSSRNGTKSMLKYFSSVLIQYLMYLAVSPCHILVNTGKATFFHL